MKAKWMLAMVGVLLAGYGLGRWSGPLPTLPAADSGNAGDTVERKVLYYRNPMGLPDTSPVPKKDSMGMDYLPVYAEDEAAAGASVVVIGPEKVQRLGVRTAPVVLEGLRPRWRLSARVEVDESREFVIAPRFEGWVETLYANRTGMTVRRGQPLMAVYSPALEATVEEIRIADEAAARMAALDAADAGAMQALGEAARSRLRHWGLTAPSDGAPGSPRALLLPSPVDAVVMERRVVQGERFEAGQTVLRLADLSQVWIVADLPLSGSAGVDAGLAARFETPSLPGETFDGEIGFVQPVVDRERRALAVRLPLANPDGRLRPGLFGELRVQGAAQPVGPVVDRSAVIDSGTRQIVLVQIAPGRFQPREVELGLQVDGRVAVRSGLREGEQVVTSANFLIDGESRLAEALQGLAPAGEASTTSTSTGVPDRSVEPAPAAAAPHAHHGHDGAH